LMPIPRIVYTHVILPVLPIVYGETLDTLTRGYIRI
jgi:hypothetical protein